MTLFRPIYQQKLMTSGNYSLVLDKRKPGLTGLTVELSPYLQLQGI